MLSNDGALVSQIVAMCETVPCSDAATPFD